VCDDDPDVLEVVGGMLRGQGYTPIGVQSGEEAVARSIDARPAAILLDLAMPGMDGWETLVALKARAETRDIPVVIVSGVERTGLEPTDATAAWMTKPVSAEALREVLHRALGRDMVLLDLSSDTGLEVVDWLRTRDQLPRVPIVVYSERELDAEAVRDGVIEVLRHAVR
jgi:CheY-like chemotaxis protein